MKIKKSRSASFIILLLIYIAASFIGIIIYENLNTAFWISLLIADAAATVFVFVFSLIFKNASVYDPYWSVQPIVIILFCAFTKGVSAIQIIFLCVICFWGIRLTSNWAYTFHGLQYQDWRYTMLNEKTKSLYPFVNFTGIHMVPTLIVYACTLPAVFVFEYQPEINFGSVIFLFVSVLATIIQGISDIQMHKFRKGKTGGFIRTGLWKYSRHPNYLSEIMMWWGIALASLCSMPERPYLLIGALLNTVLFLCVSIPLADGHQSRKPGFDEYKRETRMLLPFKK